MRRWPSRRRRRSPGHGCGPHLCAHCAMGFTEPAASAPLAACGGDQERAVDHLLAEPVPAPATPAADDTAEPAAFIIHLKSKMDGFDAIPPLTLGVLGLQTTVLGLKHQCVTHMKIRMHAHFDMHLSNSDLAARMELQLAGQLPLQDAMTLADSDLKSGATLWVKILLRGGGGGTADVEHAMDLQAGRAFASAFATGEILPDGKAFVMGVSVFNQACSIKRRRHWLLRQPALRGKAEMGSRKLLLLEDGTEVVVTVKLPSDAFEVENEADSFVWGGADSHAQYEVICLCAAELRKHAGKAWIYTNGHRAASCEGSNPAA